MKVLGFDVGMWWKYTEVGTLDARWVCMFHFSGHINAECSGGKYVVVGISLLDKGMNTLWTHR